MESGWGYTARVYGSAVHEQSSTTAYTTASICMEVKAVTEALKLISSGPEEYATFLTDSMSTLDKIRSGHLYADGFTAIQNSHLEEPGVDLLSWACRCEGQLKG